MSVEVSGGKLLGLGSACPYNELGYCGTKTDTYYGQALAVVRAGEGGAVELRVADGRLSGSIAIPVAAE